MEPVRIALDNDYDLSGAILFDASPTPAAAGIIASTFLVDNLKARKVGEIKSIYFPQISIVTEDGLASPPKVELFLYEDRGRKLKLLFMVRNFPIESNEGSYLIAKFVYDFFKQKGVKEYFFLGSLRITGGKDVYVSSTKIQDMDKLINAGAKLFPSMEIIPMDRLSSFLLYFFARDGKPVRLMFSDTPVYIPDPAAARNLVNMLSKFLDLSLDTSKLDEEARKQKSLVEEMEKEMYGPAAVARREERYPKEPSYIS